MKRTNKKQRPPIGTLTNPWYSIKIEYINKYFRFTSYGIWMVTKEGLPHTAIVRQEGVKLR